MKVLYAIEWETHKDEAKRKKYYEFFDEEKTWEKTHESVKYKDLGTWADQPGHLTFLTEYESMEEFSKVWSDEEFQKYLVKWRSHCKSSNGGHIVNLLRCGS
jgi:hypothetical protein